MRNNQQLMALVARAERGVLLPGEAQILREALQLLDDMATTLDKMMGRHPGDYETTSTQSMRVVQQAQPFASDIRGHVQAKWDNG